MEQTLMLEVTQIHSYYGNIKALAGVSLQISRGEIITLIGANGAGKSTTLMSICGIVPPRSGKITFEGESIHTLAADRIAALGIAQVPEGRHIFPHLTVRENLDMGAYLRRDRAAIGRDLEYVLTLFPRLAERIQQAGGTLSGGEQQMLAISRALMARPKLLLLDEPSMGLAPLMITQIFETIRQINQEHNTTIFLVEQNANQALQIADRGYVIENGVVTISDRAEALMQNEGVKRAYLGI
jgi:branched-chain amino acid transport system ATP-binding protein